MPSELPNPTSGAPYDAPVVMTAGKVDAITSGPTQDSSEESGGFKTNATRHAPRAEEQDR